MKDAEMIGRTKFAFAMIAFFATMFFILVFRDHIRHVMDQETIKKDPALKPRRRRR